MAFHHQPDQPFARLIGLGEKLLGGGLDGFGVAFHFDLRDRFHRHGDALFGVEILLRRDVERHQLQRKLAVAFHHRENHGSPAFHDAGAAEAVNHQRFMRARFSVQPGGNGQ